ncbi:MAG: type II secretion system minor pseudopilin GspK [Hyphomonadaceae bacterium]|nr:type II secretion system minor pseudopilin GspK [Hyphomonadaceae bacterium]
MNGQGASFAREGGAALVSALLIVAIMSATAIAVLDSINMAARASVNVANRNQAEHYAIGAETLAATTLEDVIATRGPLAQRLLDEQTRQPIVMPVENGQLRVLVRDGANCFNLNALVEPSEGRLYSANSETVNLFADLLETLGVVPGEAESLANSVADWIDSDGSPRFGGAEDEYYGSLKTPYRTPGQYLVDLSELYLVRGFTPELVTALEPFVCVRASFELEPLNINSLTEQQLPLLAVYLGDEINLYQAEDVLRERPVGGYAAKEDMFEVPVLAQFSFAPELQERIATVSRRYDLLIRVDYRQSGVGLTSALVVDEAGKVATESRRFGVPR